MSASVRRAVANPFKFMKVDTKGNGEQTQDGTPDKDVVLQFGFGGNDTLYREESKVTLLLFRMVGVATKTES
jgi:hypothetical protein